jgi:FMN phosphatase YigB (HAD superfamily)
MSAPVILLDVDNTLLDNDRFLHELGARLERDFGASECARYWAIYAELRVQLGYADYLGTLQKFRLGLDEEPKLLQMSEFLLQFPFETLLFPQALEVIAQLRSQGTPVILSDGDIVFQPRKIQHSGLWDAVEGRVLIYVHKERKLDALQRRFPAPRYVMVDDKPQLLSAMKSTLGEKLTTVFVRQGHYATEAEHLDLKPPPDRAIEHIGELLQCQL